LNEVSFISILSVIFAMIIVGQIMNIKRDVRRLSNSIKHLKKEIAPKMKNK
tara:strand:- start:30 stop:182 length:153 start_codon:yes stop_codon:yes gene_type:complete